MPQHLHKTSKNLRSKANKSIRGSIVQDLSQTRGIEHNRPFNELRDDGEDADRQRGVPLDKAGSGINNANKFMIFIICNLYQLWIIVVIISLAPCGCC